MQTVVSLVQALAWPVVVVVVFFLLRREVKAFLARVGQVQLKAGGFEATATSQQQLQAAAALGAAAARGTGTGPASESTQVTQIQANEIGNAVRSAAAAPKQISGAQVLWVDDRPENNVYERQALEALGVQFTISRSTDDAIERLRSQQFDAVISDMGRPPDQRAGYTLLAKLKEAGITAPYIIYAGSASPEHKAEAARNGAFGTTNRPQDLFRMVIDAINGASTQAG